MRISHAIIGTLALSLLAACTAQTDTGTQNTSSTGSAKAVTVHWSWVQTGTGSMSEPIQDVMLMEDGGKQLIKVSCTGTVAPVEVVNALAVRCWWAGGGEDFAVFQTGATLQISKRSVDEESGFGNWEPLQALQ